MTQLLAVYASPDEARPAARNARDRWLADVRRAVHLPAHAIAWATSAHNLEHWWPLAVKSKGEQ